MFAHKIKSIRPLHSYVLVEGMNFAERKTAAGIVLRSDDKTSAGVRPRWGKVYAIGPDQTDVKIGDWICIKHGRWTRGIDIEDANGKRTIRRVDNDDIWLVSDEEPVDETLVDL